jgi:P27 family predicted phage terminase small subunit
MPGKGFAPAPKAVKLAKGERRPSRVNYEEPELPPPSSLAAPIGLDGAGKKEWDRQVALLSDRGVLTDSDLVAFEDYCRALSELRRFEVKARKAGPELAIAKGYQGVVIKLRAQVNQLRQQCGLTPSSRSGVKASRKSSGPANPAERYLRALPGGKTS